MSFRSGRESRHFLVPDMDPLHAFATPNGIGDGIQAVADDPVDALDASGGEGGDELVGDFLGHDRSSALQTKARAECFERRASIMAAVVSDGANS